MLEVDPQQAGRDHDRCSEGCGQGSQDTCFSRLCKTPWLQGVWWGQVKHSLTHSVYPVAFTEAFIDLQLNMHF